MKKNRLQFRVTPRQQQKLQQTARVFTVLIVIATTILLYNILGLSKDSKADNNTIRLENRLEGFSFATAININFDALNLKTSFVDIPVLAEINAAELKYYTKGGLMQHEDASDLTFTLADGITPVPHQIERYDPAKGKVIVWLRIAELNKNKSNVLMMYAGNIQKSEIVNATVFSAPAKAVFHFNNEFKNVLSNEVYGESLNVKDEEGKIASCKSFHSYSKSNAIINLSSLSAHEGSLTVNFWINPSELKDKSLPIAQLGPEGGFVFKLSNNNIPSFEIRNKNLKSAEATASKNIASNQWTMVTGVFNAAKDSLYLYINGDLCAREKSGIRYNANGKLFLGGNTGYYFDGMLDELQIHFEAFNSDKISFVFNNQSTPANFFKINDREYLKAHDDILAFNSFDAEARAGHVLLSWSTIYEQNVDFFRIERSADGENFEKIASQFASGISNDIKPYFIIDPKPLTQTAYYRIIGIGFNNEKVCSNLQSVSYVESNQPVVIDAVEPNPFENKFEVKYKLNRPEKALLSITNIHGERVHEAFVDQSSESYAFDHGNKLLPGIYFISLKQANEQHTLRLVKRTK